MAESYMSKNMYILGEAINGPVNSPVQIMSKSQCLNVFGNSKLTEAWYEAYQVGGDDVNYFCVRINGEEATLTIKGEDERHRAYNALTLRSYCAGELWNSTNITITADYLRISNPSAIGGYIEIDFSIYQSVIKVVEVINLAFQRGMIGVKAATNQNYRPSTDIAKAYRTRYDGPIYLIGGEDGLNFSKNKLHELLEVTYNIIEGQDISTLIVAGAYFDDVSPKGYYDHTEYGSLFYAANRDYLDLPHDTILDKPATFHGQLINFCKSQMNHAIVTHGIIALNPLENIEDYVSENAYATKVASATCMNDKHDIIDKEAGADNGKYISIVCGDFEYVDVAGIPYYNNGYAGYAALVTAMTTQESLTNKRVPNIPGLRYYFTDEEANLLSQMGITSFRWSALEDSLVVTNSVTASLNSSPYHVVSNMRMIQLIICAFKRVMDEFVGGNIQELIKSNAMQKAADELVKNILSTKIVKGLKATVTISLTGAALINLQILATYSIEYVQATGSIKL